MRTEVYYNLHKKCLSIKALEGPNRGRVVCHAPAAALENATFVVRQGGRERVLREKRKNVHAFVRGEWLGTPPAAWTLIAVGKMRLATYNPYKYNSFVDKQTEQPLTSASSVIINGREVWYS